MKKNKIQIKKTNKKKGGFFAFLFRIAETIAKLLKRGPIGYFFADLYTKFNQKWKNGYIYNLLRRKKQRLRERATFAHIYEKSLTSKKISQISYSIIHSNLRIWGVGFLFFAFAIITIAPKFYEYIEIIKQYAFQ